MKEVKFEEIMQELEIIANDLEKGNLSLEESILQFEKGIKLSKQCNDIIEKAERKVNILLQKEGELVEEKFVVEE